MPMKKDFDEWNKEKKATHERGENKLYGQREIGFLEKNTFALIRKSVKDLL